MGQYYKNYMKKRAEEKPSYVKLFIGAFIVMIVLFSILVTHFSPDTTIGENDEGDTKESGVGVKHLIDNRLKFIQMEDSGKVTIDNYSQKRNNPDLEKYGKDIQQTVESGYGTGYNSSQNGYSGQYNNTYSSRTSQTQSKSRTYDNGFSGSTNYQSQTPTSSSSYASRTYSAPTQSTQLRSQVQSGAGRTTSRPATTTQTRTTTPNTIKNLTPAGMN